MSKKDKVKALCDWKKGEFVERIEEFRLAVASPVFGCKKCGRVAAEQEYLCKPFWLHGKNKDKA